MAATEVVWKNFAFSVWLLIAYAMVAFSANILQAPELDAAFGPFSARVALWPLAAGGIALLLWFKPFRRREHGARLMAGVVGALLLLQPVLSTLLISDLYGRSVDWPRWWLITYVALSHLAFAFWGRELR